MLVTMVEDRTACPDGVTAVRLAAGTTVDLPDHLAAAYLERGLATKDAGAAAEDKDAGAAPENKQTPPRRPAAKRSRRAS